MRTLDVYSPAAAVGPRNLAADDLLLARAVAGRAGLRVYTWATPTVSLGYFQPAADAELVPGLAGLPVVRRATDLALTYKPLTIEKTAKGWRLKQRDGSAIIVGY